MSRLEFKNFGNKLRVPIIVYADFECILKPVDDQRVYQEHEPFSVGFYVQYNLNKEKSKYFCYRKETAEDEDPAKWFVEQLHHLAEELEAAHKNPLPMKDVDEQAFQIAKTCHICRRLFSEKDKKVRDHCHLTGL